MSQQGSKGRLSALFGAISGISFCGIGALILALLGYFDTAVPDRLDRLISLQEDIRDALAEGRVEGADGTAASTQIAEASVAIANAATAKAFAPGQPAPTLAISGSGVPFSKTESAILVLQDGTGVTVSFYEQGSAFLSWNSQSGRAQVGKSYPVHGSQGCSIHLVAFDRNAGEGRVLGSCDGTLQLEGGAGS